MTLLRLELIRWWRSRKLMILCLVFIFSGISSPVFSYYTNDILASMGGTSSQMLTLPDPTWQQLLISYFKNTSQLSLFIAIYLISDMCQLGKNQALRLFYLTRGKSASQIFLPKLAIGLVLGLVSAFLGQLSSLYVTWVFFNHLPLLTIFQAFAYQLIGIGIFIVLGVYLSLFMRSSFVSALILEVIIVLSGLFAGTGFDEWSPTGLLSLTSVFDHYTVPKMVWLFAIGIIVVSLLGIVMRRLRYSNDDTLSE